MSNLVTTKNKKSLAAWIAAALNDPDKEKPDGTPAPCVGMSLMHMKGQAEVEIDGIKFRAGTTYKPEEIAKRFQGKIETDADGLMGVQQYVVYAFYETHETWGNRFPIQYANSEFAHKGLSTEGPDKTGQTMQGMRLTEMIVQGTFGALANTLRQQSDLISKYATMHEQTQAENREMFGMLREVLMDQVQKSHEMKMKEMEYQRSTEERKILMKYVPALTNTIVGKEVFPQETADGALVDSLMDAIIKNEKNLETVAKLDLPPHVMGPLMAKIEKYMKEKEEREKATKALTSGLNGTGEYEEDGHEPH